jgi:tRNA1Val (adenine37-N6)-methyltransferase
VGIEQHEPSIQQAKKSLSEGPFTERGAFIQANFLKWESEKRFDLIVSNPPFFDKAQATDQPQRDAARRQFSLSHEAMLKKMKKHLNEKASICLILPTSEAEALYASARNIDLHLNELCTVSSFPNSAVIRHLMRFSTQQSELETSDLAIRQAAREWSEAYRALTNDFHP